jgi:hypothetical protein
MVCAPPQAPEKVMKIKADVKIVYLRPNISESLAQITSPARRTGEYTYVEEWLK